MTLKVGDVVVLQDEFDCVIPAGEHVVTEVGDDGSFCVGGHTRAWPRRIIRLNGEPVTFDRY